MIVFWRIVELANVLLSLERIFLVQDQLSPPSPMVFKYGNFMITVQHLVLINCLTHPHTQKVKEYLLTMIKGGYKTVWTDCFVKHLPRLGNI